MINDAKQNRKKLPDFLLVFKPVVQTGNVGEIGLSLHQSTFYIWVHEEVLVPTSRGVDGFLIQ